MFTSSQISDFIIYERDEPVVDTICRDCTYAFLFEIFSYTAIIQKFITFRVEIRGPKSFIDIEKWESWSF